MVKKTKIGDVIIPCSSGSAFTVMMQIFEIKKNQMMITNKGCLFHIDYGYILGSDPKFMAPEIRSTPEMIDAMNGYDSEWYEDYKTKCSRAYNCLRRHANVFMLLLSPLYKMTPTILNNKKPFTKNMIAEQVMKRFIPNENLRYASSFDARRSTHQNLDFSMHHDVPYHHH